MAIKPLVFSEATELTAISPLDGRYRKTIQELAPFVSEMALINTRIEVEAKYLIALSESRIVRSITNREKKLLINLGQNMTTKQIERVKEIEKTTRHDVKAVERAFRELLKDTSLNDLVEMIHFGLTSEDINNLSYRLLLQRATYSVCLPTIEQIVEELVKKANRYKATAMISRTHGQPALPTTLGKEFSVFAIRLHTQLQKLKKQKFTGKLNGAVGNFNALHFAYPNVNWINFSKNFVSSFGFIPNLSTTQINAYDDTSECFQTYQRINSIIVDLDQDIWRYISDNWFIQEVKKGEVGSSTMPQKVNPIDFENSEGNLGMANAILGFMSSKLIVSRLQRDLSDSTVIRNIGTALGFCLIGYKSTLNGLKRIIPNEDKIDAELQKDWVILTEAVQTILRKAGVSDPYSLIASISRGNHIKKDAWKVWVGSLPVEKKYKIVLKNLTPNKYTGLAVKLTERAISQIKK
ncbi:MAG: hypothetical protein ACD_50C00045G0008 [uncultured bacterium]|nr:MAG: hypothetical protein ACD_50C00045G0008 [uncultured bacterium]OGH13330.1 MAG: adenylosuccinate lyase [Candidatus Levybacteria bacterium RIFCSPHIGHO2_01_FULL_38_26]